MSICGLRAMGVLLAVAAALLPTWADATLPCPEGAKCTPFSAKTQAHLYALVIGVLEECVARYPERAEFYRAALAKELAMPDKAEFIATVKAYPELEKVMAQGRASAAASVHRDVQGYCGVVWPLAPAAPASGSASAPRG